MAIGLVLVITVVLLFGLMVGSIWLVNYAARRIVGDKHQTLEHIAETDRIPDSWRQPYDQRVGRLESAQASPDQIQAAKRREAGKILRRLDKLLRYADHTPLVSDEQTRKDLVDTLEAVYDRWAQEVPE